MNLCPLAVPAKSFAGRNLKNFSVVLFLRQTVFADLESALRVEKIFRAYILSRINMRPFAFMFSKKIFAAFFSYSAKFLPAARFCCAFIS